MALFAGYGYRPVLVEGASFDGENPMEVHGRMATALDEIVAEIGEIQQKARSGGVSDRTDLAGADHSYPEGSGPARRPSTANQSKGRSERTRFRWLKVRTNHDHLVQLESWLRSYRPEELFDSDGSPVAVVGKVPPEGPRRIGANPHANGGLLLVDLELPDFRVYGVDVSQPGVEKHEATRVLGSFLRDIIVNNPDQFSGSSDPTRHRPIDCRMCSKRPIEPGMPS